MDRVGEPDDPDVFTAFAMSAEERAVMAEAVGKAMTTAGPDYGKALRAMGTALADVNVIQLMGAVAVQYATHESGKNPEFDRRDGMFWHHVELIQAFALREGSSQASQPLTEVVPCVSDAVKELDRAWLLLEVTKVDQAAPAEHDRAAALM